MTHRPTPSQVADQFVTNAGHMMLDALRENGYRIVSEEDIRARDERIIRATCRWRNTWEPTESYEFDDIVIEANTGIHDDTP